MSKFVLSTIIVVLSIIAAGCSSSAEVSDTAESAPATTPDSVTVAPTEPAEPSPVPAEEPIVEEEAPEPAAEPASTEDAAEPEEAAPSVAADDACSLEGNTVTFTVTNTSDELARVVPTIDAVKAGEPVRLLGGTIDLLAPGDQALVILQTQEPLDSCVLADATFNEPDNEHDAELAAGFSCEITGAEGENLGATFVHAAFATDVEYNVKYGTFNSAGQQILVSPAGIDFAAGATEDVKSSFQPWQPGLTCKVLNVYSA